MHTSLGLVSLLLALANPGGEGVGPPYDLVIAHAGRVLRVDANGERLLADCSVTTEVRVIRTGARWSETKPCAFDSFATHPGTGRWAVTVSPSDSERITLSGRSIEVPRGRGGRPKEGSVLVLGDARGIFAISTGNPRMWTDNGKFYSQFVDRFTPDGSHVLVSSSAGSTYQWWNWSFEATPQGRVVLPPGETDVAGNTLVDGSARTVLRSEQRGVRVAELSPDMTRPWKIGRALPLARRGMNQAVVLDEVMVFYREGLWDEGGCDERSPGTYRRYDLVSGRETTWRRDEGRCSSGGEPFVAASAARRTAYFMDHDHKLLEYAIDTDTVSPIALERLQRVLDLSADGRVLLAATWDGLVLYDLVRARTLWTGAYHGDSLALSAGFSSRGSDSGFD